MLLSKVYIAISYLFMAAMITLLWYNLRISSSIIVTRPKALGKKNPFLPLPVGFKTKSISKYSIRFSGVTSSIIVT